MKKIHYFNIPANETLLPLYPISLGLHFKQREILREEGYTYYQWIQTAKGHGIFRSKDNTYDLPEGFGVFLDPNTYHHYEKESTDWETHWLVFHGAYIPHIFQYLGLSFNQPYAIVDLPKIDTTLNQLKDLCSQTTTKGFMEASTVLYDFLYGAGSNLIHTNSTTFRQFQKIEPVIQTISRSYYEDLSIQRLADLLHVSPQHFCVLFKDITGLRPIQYINKIRIRHAKEMLTGKQKSIEEIARLCGFDNTSYFYTVFKKEAHISPGQFRKQIRGDQR